MILTVTINPLLERRINYAEVSLGRSHRSGKEILMSGGKGINVSRQLNKLEIQNLAFLFLGGTNGKLLRNILNDEELIFTAISTKQETRNCTVVIDESKSIATSFFSPNAIISIAESNEFKLKLDKMIQNCEMVVFSGSSPCKEADDIFPFGIEAANKYDKISVCDTYGTHLSACLEKSPTIVHNNIDEVESSLNISLKSEKEKIEYLDSLYSKGIKQTYLTNGEKEIYASTLDYKFKIIPPKISAIDPTGSGDAFTAGIVYGWHHDLTFDETIKLACSLGSVNAGSFSVCEVFKQQAEKYLDDVQILSIGKKMKLLDVTPNNI
jgi:1-phosphofructokinase family hexose kinase